MASIKISVLILTTTIISNLVQCQEGPVFNAYSPGGSGGVPSYRATPRLVGVKVGVVDGYRSDLDEFLEGAEGRNIRVTARPPYSYGSDGVLHLQSAHPLSNPVSYAFVQQPGEGLPIRRIRVNNSPSISTYAAASPSYAATSPYAATHQAHSGGVQYAQVQAPQQRQVVYSAAPTYRPIEYSPAPQQPQYQQREYYAANPRPKVVQHQSRPVLKVQKAIKPELEEEEPQYPSDPNPQYNFAFDVKDDDFTNYQNRQESKQGGVTKGSYSVVDPDGYVRTVTYEASPKGGFKAKVTREPTDVKIRFPVPTPAPQEDGKAQQQQQQQQLYAYAPQARRYPHRLAPQYAQ